MKLRTPLDVPAFDFKLDHSSGILTLGSCFSDVIGNYLQHRKFSVKSNPFGTVYNIMSIYHAVVNALEDLLPDEDRVVTRDGLFFHLDYHSHFYGDTHGGLMDRINAAGRDFRSFFGGAELLIITFGTSWVYNFEELAVANCHKLPASHFQKQLLSLEAQVEMLSLLMAKLRRFNPKLRLMFTVSPVRHIKDGIPENGLSKAILRVLCDEAVKYYPGTFYFPSFEIMMDDLRDYRFYKPDLIHPDEVAENYICDLFMKSVISEEAHRISEEWNKVSMALDHRPMNPGSGSHRAFLENLLVKIKTFRPFFEVSEECEVVERWLENGN